MLNLTFGSLLTPDLGNLCQKKDETYAGQELKLAGLSLFSHLSLPAYGEL